MTRRQLLKQASLLSPVILAPSCTSIADLALRQQYLTCFDESVPKPDPYVRDPDS